MNSAAALARRHSFDRFLLQMQPRPSRTTPTGKIFSSLLRFCSPSPCFSTSLSRRAAERTVEKTRLVFLYERKEQTFENLRDLNFEYKAGKLSDADFSSMRDTMEQEAANILAEIEQLESESGSRQEVNA